MKRTASCIIALAGAVLVCSAATYPKGVDVSNHQGSSIDWLQVAGAGYTFAFAKASEGTTFTDSTYAINRTGTKAAGIYFGAYHFAQPAGASDATITASAIAQADHFVDVAQPRGGDLPPVLDLETVNGLKQPALVKWTQAWLDEVAARTGASAMVYTSPSFWKTYLGDAVSVAAGGHHLWVAHWTTASAPLVPAANWNGLGWSFWQWSNCLAVPGIPTKCVDGDRASADPGGVTLAPLPSGAPSSATRPTIVGTPRAGAKLAAVPGTWNGGKPVAFTYQWQTCDGLGANCVQISGATLETYTPSTNDVGRTIAVAVTATAKSLTASASSAPTTPIAAASGATVPAVVASPQISGTAMAGATLTATTGTWSGSPTSYAFQWQRCDASAASCAPIDGATAATYVLTPGDIGATIEVFVTATNSVGSQTATSSPTGVVLAAPVPAPTPDSATAQLGQAGAVVTSDGSATVTWQPGAVPVGSAVGLSVSGAQLALTLSPQVAKLAWPVDLAYATPPDATQVVGFSTDGRVWSPVAPLTAAALPAGLLAGVFQGHVLTRKPGFYRLFVANAWGDPRKVSRFAPRLQRVAPIRVTTLRSGARVVSTRMSTSSQILLQPGHRRILAPGTFPVRIRVRKGTHAVHLVAVDPWGRRGGFTLSFR